MIQTSGNGANSRLVFLVLLLRRQHRQHFFLSSWRTSAAFINFSNISD
jgi:hypothetical protein